MSTSLEIETVLGMTPEQDPCLTIKGYTPFGSKGQIKTGTFRCYLNSEETLRMIHKLQSLLPKLKEQELRHLLEKE